MSFSPEPFHAARALLLLVHVFVETGLVGLEAALFGHVVHDVQREAVGVVQLERGFAGMIFSPLSARASFPLQAWRGPCRGWRRSALFLAGHAP
ncbi:MAG: hypothetical protein ACLSHC_11940 [Bilophila wadsworthia]